ncbi:MAG: peptidase E [Thermobacillus sp. ZCTH02-B1]|nr:MAG: peptidase E [Thermobacillus sp. ZCTH02-B1]
MTSNGFFTDEIKAQFLRLVGGAPADCRVAIITTASPLKEQNPFAQKAAIDFREMGFADVAYVDLEFEDPEILRRKDVIYLNGGNPFTLLYHVKRSGADRVLREMVAQDVVIVGASAGSVILGPNIKIVHFFTPQMDAFDTRDFTALNLTGKLIFPHYDREDLFPDAANRTIEERLREFEAREGCTVTRLKDDGWIAEILG